MRLAAMHSIAAFSSPSSAVREVLSVHAGRVFRNASLRFPQRLVDFRVCMAAVSRPKQWLRLARVPGIVEIFCHPGTELADQEKPGSCRRSAELEFLLSPAMRATRRERRTARELLECLTMRILMIIPQIFYSTRGTPISAYHRIRELISHGHEVDVLTYKPGAEPPDLAAKIYRSHGPHFASGIKSGPSRLKIWFDVLLFGNLFYRLMRRRYDALYAHEEAAFLARIVGAVFRTPYVYDMHSSLPRQIRDWKFSNKQWVVNLFSWVERFSVRGARVVVAISPAVEEVARALRPDVPVVVIVNHYETSAGSASFDGPAARLRHKIDPQTKLVVYTGSFVALQALDVLIAAAPLVRAQVPDVKFLLVGGSQKEIDELSALAVQFNVADCFVFEAVRPQSEMPGYMAAADVLVSPRVVGINPPGKLFSYLASGKPVVATNTLVHNQLLDPSRAILTDPTPQRFAEGVVTGLTDPRRGAEVVAGARTFLTTYCGAEARSSAYRALAAHLVGLRPHASNLG